jgi:hypothetical protein
MAASFIRLRPTPVHQSPLSQTRIYALLLDMRHLNHRCQGTPTCLAVSTCRHDLSSGPRWGRITESPHVKCTADIDFRTSVYMMDISLALLKRNTKIWKKVWCAKKNGTESGVRRTDDHLGRSQTLFCSRVSDRIRQARRL